MASLTPRNIVQTSADLDGLVIHSEAGKTKIPSMYLLDELSANLTTKLDNLGKILDLNEIKWLGVSTTDPTQGTITINGITYKNDDIDNGNYVTYTAPGTSAELKYIFGHGIWENIGDVVNLPENFVKNKHINQYAGISLEKIGGLDLGDLRNPDAVLSDVTNLRTTLKAMIDDYKQVDINQIISDVEGNVTNTINLCVNGSIENLGIEQKFQDISGNVFNTMNLCMENVFAPLSIGVEQTFSQICSVVSENNMKVDNINGQVVNLNADIQQYYQEIGQIVANNSISVEKIIADYANVNNSIKQNISAVSGDIISYNNIASNVEAVIANVSNDIETKIINSTIGQLNMVNTITSYVEASCAHVYNTITTEINDSLIGQLTMINTICSEVSAASAWVENTIGTTFNNCNIGSIASYDDSFYNALNSYAMRYCGEFASLDEANRKITELSVCQKKFTVPYYNSQTSSLTTREQTVDFTVHLIEKGSVIAVGNATNGYEHYMCIQVPPENRRSIANINEIKWRPLVDDKIYIKRSAIEIVSQLPADNALVDGKFYVVVDPE